MVIMMLAIFKSPSTETQVLHESGVHRGLETPHVIMALWLTSRPVNILQLQLNVNFMPLSNLYVVTCLLS